MIALYMRLSSADGDLGKDGKDESNSIEHQRAILRDYIHRRDDIIGDIREYVDDGYSGTNFNRPAFKSMLEDMKRGCIDTVLTKDLSRLGRNYIEVGDYMDQIFPMLGVRYIAVNSNYDSKDYIGSTSGIDMSFMNLVNSLYSKDLSKKYRTAVETRWRNGQSTSGRMPLGYVRDPKVRGGWIIEPVGREIVRKIYDLVNEGFNQNQIVDRLNEEHVITPGQYREKMGHVKVVDRKVSDDEWLWDRMMLRRVLQTYEYTGALVQSKKKTIVVGSGRRRTVPKDERFITENHHEPIITIDEYEKGKSLIREVKKGTVVNSCKYPLGLVTYCGHCGLSMEYSEKISGSFMRCKHKELVGAASRCPATLYSTEIIDSAVRSSLKAQIYQFELLKIKLSPKEPVVNNSEEKRKLDIQILRIKNDNVRAYELYADGKISKNEYIARKNKNKIRLHDLNEKKTTALSLSQKKSDLCEEADYYVNLMEELGSGRELTKNLVDAFIEKVYIHDINHIEVKFKFDDLMNQMISEIEN